MLNDFNQPKGSTIGVLKDGRTIQQAFDEIPVISVLRFGAKGDGVADDYPAFQRAALEAQRIGGGGNRRPNATRGVQDWVPCVPVRPHLVPWHRY